MHQRHRGDIRELKKSITREREIKRNYAFFAFAHIIQNKLPSNNTQLKIKLPTAPARTTAVMINTATCRGLQLQVATRRIYMKSLLMNATDLYLSVKGVVTFRHLIKKHWS